MLVLVAGGVLAWCLPAASPPPLSCLCYESDPYQRPSRSSDNRQRLHELDSHLPSRYTIGRKRRLEWCPNGHSRPGRRCSSPSMRDRARNPSTQQGRRVEPDGWCLWKTVLASSCLIGCGPHLWVPFGAAPRSLCVLAVDLLATQSRLWGSRWRTRPIPLPVYLRRLLNMLALASHRLPAHSRLHLQRGDASLTSQRHVKPVRRVAPERADHICWPHTCERLAAGLVADGPSVLGPTGVKGRAAQ